MFSCSPPSNLATAQELCISFKFRRITFILKHENKAGSRKSFGDSKIVVAHCNKDIDQ